MLPEGVTPVLPVSNASIAVDVSSNTTGTIASSAESNGNWASEIPTPSIVPGNKGKQINNLGRSYINLFVSFYIRIFLSRWQIESKLASLSFFVVIKVLVVAFNFLVLAYVLNQ